MSVEETTELGPADMMVAGGQTCDVEPNRGVVYTGLGVERLRAGSPQGEFLKLEGVPKIPLSTAWTLTALVALGASDVLVAANSVINQEQTVGYFGRWQGATFTAQPSPFEGPVNLLWFETPDVLWATDLQHSLWRRQAGNWARVPWVKPEGDDTEITQGWARGANDVWLVTHSTSRKSSAVYHSR
jgi:hypothetical protein